MLLVTCPSPIFFRHKAPQDFLPHFLTTETHQPSFPLGDTGQSLPSTPIMEVRRHIHGGGHLYPSTHSASLGPREFKGHISPGSTYCVLPWTQGNGLTCLVIHSFIHSLSKHSISVKPMLRARRDPKSPTALLGRCTQQPQTLDRAFGWAEHFFWGTTSTIFLSSSKPFGTTSLSRNPATPKGQSGSS